MFVHNVVALVIKAVTASAGLLSSLCSRMLTSFISTFSVYCGTARSGGYFLFISILYYCVELQAKVKCMVTAFR